MRHFDLLPVQQMIVHLAGVNRRFRGDRQGLRKSLHPAVKFASRHSHLAFPADQTAHILNAIADCPLVNIQPDVVHKVR